MEVSGATNVRIDHITYPVVDGIKVSKETRFVLPQWMGQVTYDMSKVFWLQDGSPRRREWTYPGTLSMQWLALYGERRPDLYVATDDTTSVRRQFVLTGSRPEALTLEVEHPLGHDPASGSSFRIPCATVLGIFEGDWMTAAELYRSWGTKQYWARESRLVHGRVPRWARETGLWIWNRGRSELVLKPAQRLQELTPFPISVHWHWWHGCSYDAGFPEYLPPREGSASFKAAVAEAKSKGIHSIVYMNQRLWGINTKSWEERGAERYAVKDAAGAILSEVYNTFTGEACAPMCLATTFWRDTYASLADTVVNQLNVDGVYMDQACATLPCFDPTHGHPIGGGSYWVESFRMLTDVIRERTEHNPDVLLAGEGVGEAWMPHLDLFLALQVSKERYATPDDGWEPTPLFQFVYHPFALTYGNYSSLTLPPYDDLWPAQFAPKEPLKLLDRTYSRQFYLEQARVFVWGQQPTIANFMPTHIVDRSEEIRFVLDLASLRLKALKYLQHGTFLRPPTIEAPNVSIPLSRLSIYAGQREGQTAWERSYGGVLSSAWRADDGNVALVFASILDTALSVPYAADLRSYGLPTSGRIVRLDQDGERNLGEFDAGFFRGTVTLRPREACVLEFRADRW
jgi:hypothetical protein